MLHFIVVSGNIISFRKKWKTFLFCFYNDSCYAICCFLFLNRVGAMQLINSLGACFLSSGEDLQLHTSGPEACALE